MEDWEAGWDRKKSGGKPPHSTGENGPELSKNMVARW
jgi:hypothetical protein